MSNFYSKWIDKNKSDNDALLEQLRGGAAVSRSKDPAKPAQGFRFSERPLKPSDIYYENDDFRLIVNERKHSRQKNFKVQDALFEIKVIPLKDTHDPLLVDLLTFLEKGCELILSKLRRFFKADEHRIAFLTLYQSPMINGLNSGGFDLYDESGGVEIVSHILSMLYNYLNSNEALKLNDTFKLFITVFSIAHENFKKAQGRRNKKRTAQFYANRKIHVGAKSKANKIDWLLDLPLKFFDSKFNVAFQNKCLIIAFVFALLQHSYLENSRINKTFIYVQNINSSDCRRQKHAANLLLSNFNSVIAKASLNADGPYEMYSTCQRLHDVYQVQFFVFSGLASKKKLIYMYPATYNDSLRPIFLYQSYADPSHIVFIRNLNSFYQKNHRICFGCKKSFSTMNFNHLCPQKESCFSCRRFVQTSSTYVNSKLKKSFCDKVVNSEAPQSTCSRCNLTLYTQNCAEGHKKVCYGQGHFGWKCLRCQKFSYRYGTQTSEDIKREHICGQSKKCRFCFQILDENHLCKLYKPSYPPFNPSISYLSGFYFSSTGDNSPLLFVTYIEDSKKSGRYHFQNFSAIPELIPNRKTIVDLSENNFEKNSSQSSLTKHKEDFKLNFKQFRRKKRLAIIDQLLLHLMENPNTTFICNDLNSVLLMNLLEAFTSNGFCPKVIRNRRKINMLLLQELQLRIVTISFYFNCDEFELADAFGIVYDQIFFPHHFCTEKNFSYDGNIPCHSYFYDDFDSPLILAKKNNFLAAHSKHWNFAKELLSFQTQKCELLILSVNKFLNESYTFQRNSLKLTKFLHPFSAPLCTIGGFIYKLFRLVSLNFYDIRIVNHEFGFPRRKISQIEYDWASYMCYKNPEKQYRGSLNHKDGAKYYKTCIPDLVSEVDHSALFLNGCRIHGHHDNCKLFPKANELTLNPWGQSYKTLNDEFLTKIQNFLCDEDEITSVTVHWECTFNEMKKTLDYEQFLKNHYKPHPLVRLTSRECYRGALCEVFCFRWTQNAFPNEKMYFLDVNSLYAFCAVSFPFMIGSYDIILGPQLTSLTIRDNLFYYNNKKVMGGILLTFVAPHDLLHPFLLYRSKSHENLLALCRSCAETKSNGPCKHSEVDRAFTGNYMISDIEFGLNLGYKILYIFECHIYYETAFIFRDFVSKLNQLKICHSLKKSEVTKTICDELNCNRSDFKLNSFKRKYYKLLSNALFGKISERNDRNKIHYVSSQEELEDIYFSPYIIKDIFVLNSNICQVEVEPDLKKIAPNRQANCYLGAQLTSYARQTIYRKMQMIINTPNAHLYYIDCDSLVFSMPSEQNCPLPISFRCGDFKEEYKSISSFYALGRKSYFLTHENQKLTKIKGLSLLNNLQDHFSSDLFDLLLENHLLNQQTSLQIPQTRNFVNYKSHTIRKRKLNMHLSNNLALKRAIDVNPRLNSKPFGFL